ncbi:MAG: hypothetical protein LUG62_08855 [Clostridiales bacterium]|nr:hypothetical protein [Clostridiales bacterium]
MILEPMNVDTTALSESETRFLTLFWSNEDVRDFGLEAFGNLYQIERSEAKRELPETLTGSRLIDMRLINHFGRRAYYCGWVMIFSKKTDSTETYIVTEVIPDNPFIDILVGAFYQGDTGWQPDEFGRLRWARSRPE